MRQLGQAEVLEPYRTQRLTKAKQTVEVLLTATALVDDAGKMYAIATTERLGKLRTFNIQLRTRKMRIVNGNDLDVIRCPDIFGPPPPAPPFCMVSENR